MKSVGDYDNATHFPPNAGLSAQQTLPPFTYPSLQQTSNEGSRLFSQDVPVLAAVPLSAKIQGRRPTGASQTLNSVPTQQRKTRRRRGFLARSSEKPLTRSMTSQTPSSRELPSLHKQKPHARDFAPGRRQKGALNTQAIMSPFGYTTDNDASYTYTATLREAIALVQQSIKPYSPFSRRKATDLINQVAKLVDQLDQIALEEEKYGNSSSDDDDVNQPSTTISSEDSLSNSELVNIESETDNTSISSTSCQPAVGGQSSVSVEDRQHETVHAPCLQCGIKDLYYCTREGCKYSTHSCAEWKRHEESQKHSQQERFICLECPQSPPPIGVNGNSVCEFCRTSFPTLGTNLTAHYLQCQRAQQSCTTYGRKDRLIAHLRSHHSTINASQVAATGRFTVDSKWPRQCGFCGVRFKTWDERMEHIGSHFQDGLDMSSWKLPLPQPRDFRPGLKPLPKDGDDSDDDMDDTDNRPFRRRAEIQQAASSTSSSQKKAPKEYRGDGAFYQRGQTCRPPLSPVDWDSNIDEIGSKVTDHFWKTLVADRGTIGVRAQWYSRASVALERYLNDAEEPFQIQSSPVSFEPLQRKMPRDALAKGIKINSPFVDQETESVMAGEQGLRAALHVRLPPTSHPSLSPLCEPLQSVVDDSAAHLDASTIAACELRPIRPDTLLFCTEAFGGKALQLTHSEHLTVTTTAHSVTSQTSSKLCRAPSASASDYDGVTDYSSVVSFDQSPTFATGFTSHDGKRVKTSLRKRFSPIAGATARAARAAVRSLGVCRLCPSDDNNIQWLDTPSAFTSAGVSQTPYLVFAPRLIGAWNSRSKSNAGMITRPGLVRKNSPPLGIPLAAVDEMRNEYSQYIRSIVQNDIIGYIPVAYIDQGSDLPEWLLGAICSIYSTTREKDNEVYLGSTPLVHLY